MLMKIRCAKCNKDVDRIDVREDKDAQSLSIRVWCHGDEDRMTLTKAFSCEAGPGLLHEEGVAFQVERIAT